VIQVFSGDGFGSSGEWHEELFNLIPRNRIGKRRPPWDKDR
jgi:hypothetical protein